MSIQDVWNQQHERRTRVWNKKYPQLASLTEELQSRVATHVGEFVLLISRELNSHGCGHESWFVDEQICLGIIREGAITVDKNFVFQIPVSKYTRWSERSCTLSESGDLSLGPQFPLTLFDIDEPMDVTVGERGCFGGNEQTFQDKMLELKIGDEDVLRYLEIADGMDLTVRQSWFERRCNWHQYYGMARALERVVWTESLRGKVREFAKDPKKDFAPSIFLISPVRQITEDERGAIEQYVTEKEMAGHLVHWPLRDTDQNDPIGTRIISGNLEAIKKAGEIHIWYSSGSSGSIMDFGMAWALDKQIIIANPEFITMTPGKSFENVLAEIDAESNRKK